MLRLLLTTLLLCTAVASAAAAPNAAGGALTDEVAALRRSNQDLSAEVGRLRDNLVILEARVLDQQKLIEELRAAQRGTLPAERSVPPSTLSGPGSELYLRSFADYASGRYAEAARGFDAFLQGAPAPEPAANARYWLGASYLGEQQYALAVAEFRKLVADHPASPKAPEALLKMATALQQLNLSDQAREALEALRTRYPESAAAQRVKSGG